MLSIRKMHLPSPFVLTGSCENVYARIAPSATQPMKLLKPLVISNLPRWAVRNRLAHFCMSSNVANLPPPRRPYRLRLVRRLFVRRHPLHLISPMYSNFQQLQSNSSSRHRFRYNKTNFITFPIHSIPMRANFSSNISNINKLIILGLVLIICRSRSVHGTGNNNLSNNLYLCRNFSGAIRLVHQ